MPLEKINKAGERASNWNAIIKLTVGIIVFIGTCWGAWYKLQDHDAEISMIHIKIDQEKTEREAEQKLISERSDKRNVRNSEQIKELEKKGVDLMMELVELKIELAKLKKEVELKRD